MNQRSVKQSETEKETNYTRLFPKCSDKPKATTKIMRNNGFCEHYFISIEQIPTSKRGGKRLKQHSEGGKNEIL